MSRSFKHALMSALIVAAIAAPLSGMAAQATVRDARQTPCKLVSAPFGGHKTSHRTSQYLCGGVAYSITDPRLTRDGDAPRLRADSARGQAPAR